jgi:hypothetical protein
VGRENEIIGGRASSSVMIRVDLPSCAVRPREYTVVGAHFRLIGQGLKIGPVLGALISRADGG